MIIGKSNLQKQNGIDTTYQVKPLYGVKDVNMYGIEILINSFSFQCGSLGGIIMRFSTVRTAR